MHPVYRGIPYTPSTEIESPKTVRLIYRGVTIAREASSPPAARSAVPANANTERLIYRGVTYSRRATPEISYREPIALNWRYRFA